MQDQDPYRPEGSVQADPHPEIGSQARPVQEQVENVMNRRVTPALSQAAGQAEAVLQDASAEVRHQVKRLSESVQEQPITAICLAALAGFVIARLTER